ncbi:(-)-alpha-terpineol synthase-like [Primulina huaijiensis]|uniref:(-)-alpha-terpineol synthase-like n=1 Tax=Primulina huaijiensis TaxID=1492673 RepID=UPI003CC720A0
MTTPRRSGNYKRSLWDDEYLQSISSVYEGKESVERAKELKEEIEGILEEKIMGKDSILGQIEFVDVLQRLGISYHFKGYIHTIMEGLFSVKDGWVSTDLHEVALKFRLLRQHNYLVPQDVFSTFVDKNGNFKHNLSSDTRGLLSLYEASYLSMGGEEIMDKAQEFAKCHLEQNLKQQQLLDQNLRAEITRSMKHLPLHWRVPRFEAIWFISMYEKRQDTNPLVLQFAKLDFNLVQVIYQQELKELSRWHASTKLAERLSFARDRLVESFIWSIGITFEPLFGYCRKMIAKLLVLGTMIDDIYDVYGTLDELELFTLAVDRWDINALDHLPDYMKICFFALFNFVNQHSYDVLKTQGFNIVSCLKEVWANLCKAYMVEAKWISSGYTPTIHEFLENGLVSIAGPLVCFYLCICCENPIQEKMLKDFIQVSDLNRCTAVAVRLMDDLGTSRDEMKKGDVVKSIQCYMKEADCSEEEARDHVKYLFHETTKKFNRAMLSNSLLSKDVVECFMNVIRTAQCIYHTGDRHGIPDESKELVLSLILESIPLA